MLAAAAAERGRDDVSDRVDTRGEWFREWDVHSMSVNRIPRWYWLGMALSACWILAYLLVYPSLPGMSSHWKGLGVPGGCRPWTAICEMRQEQAQLQRVRGGYLSRMRGLSADGIAADRELVEFVARAGRVAFADNCAACHGRAGVASGAGPALDAGVWPHGATAQAIHRSIRDPAVHPFGLAARLDDATAKILAAYVYRLTTR